MNGFAALCQLAIPDRPRIRFLFVGSWMSHSLPPDGRSPFRPWLLLGLLVFIISHTGDLNPFWSAPMLGVHKTSILTPAPLPVQPTMTIHPLTQKSERALGQA